MRVLIFSDSHKNTYGMGRIISLVGKDMGCILHLGDCVDDAKLMSARFPEYRFELVSGNCDFDCISEPPVKLLHLGGKKILMTHGHIYHVKSSFQRLACAALENGADACFFGHTHEPAVFYENGILFMNPGSIALPRGGQAASYGVAEISDGGVEGNVVGGGV